MINIDFKIQLNKQAQLCFMFSLTKTISSYLLFCFSIVTLSENMILRSYSFNLDMKRIFFSLKYPIENNSFKSIRMNLRNMKVFLIKIELINKYSHQDTRGNRWS